MVILDTVENISYANNYGGSLGNEPCVFGRVRDIELNKESGLLKGNSGVLIFKVISREENNNNNEKEESTLLTSRERYMIPRLSIETLKKAANIKDYRYKYY